ncbi:Site-specific recombinase XerD [Maribacter dokdonensis]|uniref:Site-specific recombinase XerD n=1 Tax=Maribacter dokdonensis TaxID=320912 RepID=A0A1H4MAZ1_9FLAO|nr:site-specific integrase [Maribacter dokdonensis]SEB79695.1 Site-specific recombinase XerD [Maribacter dokdonensis]
MASIKIILWKHDQKKDGTFPLALRITQNRKTRYIFTGKYIFEKDWDAAASKVKKSYPNSTRLNNLLLTKLQEANRTLLDLETEDKGISSKQVKSEITSPLSNKSFNEIAQIYIQELEDNKKLTRLSSDRARVNHFIEFAGSDNINFREIDEAYLRRYMTFLRTKKKNGTRSIINALIVIRTIYNRAIKLGIIERKHYPFGADKIRIKFPETEKIGLSVDEMKALESLGGLTPQEEHARHVWLFSFLLAGMRVADVLLIRWSDIYDGRLHYRMNKNEKILSLKLPAKIYAILDAYRETQENADDFIFPEMRKANLKSPKDILAKTKTANKKFNKYLETIAQKAGITKKLTMHIARHTFGNISGDKIPIQTLQRLYRHSSITTTIQYQANFIHKDFDEALDSVTNF